MNCATDEVFAKANEILTGKARRRKHHTLRKWIALKIEEDPEWTSHELADAYITAAGLDGITPDERQTIHRSARYARKKVIAKKETRDEIQSLLEKINNSQLRERLAKHIARL
ncbi:hypothetical protein EBZ80_10555 [bacterium]|nr:hypothetical protein [bacterium]